MAGDASLYFHGSLAAGTVMTATIATNGATIDLGSNTINRVLLIERRITALTTSSTLDTTFQDSLDNTTFSNMPGATGALLGFKRATTTIYSSTDAIAPLAPDRIVIRADKRYMRMVTTPGTTFVTATFSVVARVVDGGFAFGVAAIDT
jgi:hypothetical protein